MNPAPANAGELSRLLAAAFARGEKAGAVDLGALNQVLEHAPEDMTVTAQSGITLAALQTELAKHQQWLAIDPPQPEKFTLGELINSNASGPRRFGCGTIRDYLLGIQVALADGTLIRSGGKVVKNVAGYDLGKLFIGAHGSLGMVTEVTFKLRPLPESEQFVSSQFESALDAERALESVFNSELTPIVLDLHNLSTPAEKALTLVLGFAGTREEVEWQVAKAGELGVAESSSLEHEAGFWTAGLNASRVSVLPSRLMAAIRGIEGISFVARAGNGIVYHRGATGPAGPELPLKLMRRLKETFDPRRILPEVPLNL